MRVSLDQALQPGQSISFDIKWWYNINDRMQWGGRSGYEYFEDFKRCANVLVEEKVLKRLYEEMIKKDPKSFKNCVTYLHMITKRINS